MKSLADLQKLREQAKNVLIYVKAKRSTASLWEWLPAALQQGQDLC